MSKVETKWLDGECVRWVCGPKARRVPKFVTAQTNGMKSKVKIEAKYGTGSVFAIGSPPPKTLGKVAKSATRIRRKAVRA